MKTLQLYSTKYNHHDPNSKMILEPHKSDTEGKQIFIHFTLGNGYINDTKVTRNLLTMLGKLHHVKVAFYD